MNRSDQNNLLNTFAYFLLHNLWSCAKISNSSNYFLNNLFINYPIAIKFLENIWELIPIMFNSRFVDSKNKQTGTLHCGYKTQSISIAKLLLLIEYLPLSTAARVTRTKS